MSVAEASERYRVAAADLDWCSAHCSAWQDYPSPPCQRAALKVDAASIAYDMANAAASDARIRAGVAW